MNEPEVPAKKGWGCLPWGVVGLVLALLLWMAMSVYNLIAISANQMKTVSFLREIIGLQWTYAADHEGNYSDARLGADQFNANAAFRRLFQEGLIDDESIFGCPEFHFTTDMNIGTAPDFDQALVAGENQWMMVAGMTPKSPAHFPLIMQNAIDASWPPSWIKSSGHPRWFEKAIGQSRSRGVAWKTHRVIIGFNDASIQTVRLHQEGDRLHLPKNVLEPEGKAPLPTMKLLDIEEVSGDLK